MNYSSEQQINDKCKRHLEEIESCCSTCGKNIKTDEYRNYTQMVRRDRIFYSHLGAMDRDIYIYEDDTCCYYCKSNTCFDCALVLRGGSQNIGRDKLTAEDAKNTVLSDKYNKYSNEADAKRNILTRNPDKCGRCDINLYLKKKELINKKKILAELKVKNKINAEHLKLRKMELEYAVPRQELHKYIIPDLVSLVMNYCSLHS